MCMLILYLIKFIHILNEIFLSTYIFFFSPKYDIYYTIYLLIIILHWILLKNECILTYIEKKLIDKNYILGSKPYYHPYHSIIPKFLIYLFEILKVINILVIFYRNYYNKYIYISILFIIGYIFFNIYKKYLK